MAGLQSFQGLDPPPTLNPYNRRYYTIWTLQLIMNIAAPPGSIWLAYRIVVLAWTSKTWSLWLTFAVCFLTLVIGYMIMVVGFVWVNDRKLLRKTGAQILLGLKTTLRPIRAGSDAWDIYDLLPPLKDHEIRLLRVMTGNLGLMCAIEHVDITTQHEIQKYTAVSYTWGSEIRNRYIFWGWRAIPVTDSCLETLKACHRVGGFQNNYCWIDQLCIDQSNPVEKAQQVQMMSEIYSKADKVLVWLDHPVLNLGHLEKTGFPQDWVQLPEILKLQQALNSHRRNPRVKYTDKRPLKALKDVVILKGMVLAATLAAFPVSVWNPDHPETVMAPNKAPSNVGALLADQFAWVGFCNIFYRQRPRDSYFRRRWVVQECKPLISRQIDCHVGGFSISIDVLSQSINTINGMRGQAAAVFSSIPRHSLISIAGGLDAEFRAIHSRRIYEDMYVYPEDFESKSGRKADLDFVLRNFAQGECQDLRDIFYSIRSMVESPDPLPQIQYDEKIDIIFRQHIDYLLAQGALTSMIQRGGLINGPQKVDLPSWCPAWTPVELSAVPRRYFVDLNESPTTFSESSPISTSVYQKGKSPLRAGGDHIVPYTYLVNNSSLSLRGVVLGRVLETQPETPYVYSTIIPDAATGHVHFTYDLSKDRALASRYSSKRVLPRAYEYYLDQKEMNPDDAKGYKVFLNSRHGILDFWITSMYLSQERLAKVTLSAKEVQQVNELLPRRMLCAMAPEPDVLPPEPEILPPQTPDDDLQDGTVRLAGLPIGFVPYNAEKNDLIVVFEGLASPMVIRKFDRSRPKPAYRIDLDADRLIEDEEYQIVGEAYFTQYSDGQVLSCSSLHWKQFRLV